MSDIEPNGSQEPMLDAIEARILGALMEKQLTTPDAYPLTLNSLVTACNQKTSREPASQYDNGEVEHCLRKLAERKLVEIEWGTRADRYSQRLSRHLGIEKKVQALLNVMMLRGPQTVHELYTRTQRMVEFAGDRDIEELLQHLLDKTTPIIMRIPRKGSLREDRYVHLLCGEPDMDAINAGAGKVVATAPLAERLDSLEQRVEQLEQQLAAMRGDS